MAKPARYDIHLVAGDDYSLTLRLLDDGDPVDTGGYVWRAQVRNGPLPDGELIAEFGVNGIAGGVELSLTNAQTTDFIGRGKLFWDVQSSSPLVRTWLAGSVIVTPEVTE
jgi:hypothetical protein